MGLFDKLFGKKEEPKKTTHKGFNELKIQKIERLTQDAVKVSFDIPTDLTYSYQFIPGQYVNFIIEINGKEERRSYSICSSPAEGLAVAIKAIPNGKVSNWFNQTAKVGDAIQVSKPEGNFKLEGFANTIVAFAAGSGITPIVSIGKSIENSSKKMTLFYGSRNSQNIILQQEIDALKNTTTHHYLSAENKAGFQNGRVNKESVTEAIKQNFDLLKADAFFLCGPEAMIVEIADVLKMFGVRKEKIHYELFTTPTIMKAEGAVETSNFSGMSKVKVILDGDSTDFMLDSNGITILEMADKEGLDAPYSCRGGVCSACKAKVTNGKAIMKMNYVLTDQEVADGYVLTCQAHPASEEVTVNFDA